MTSSMSIARCAGVLRGSAAHSNSGTRSPRPTAAKRSWRLRCRPEPSQTSSARCASGARAVSTERNPPAASTSISAQACIELHSKVNAIGEDTVRMAYRALERIKTDFDAMVIGNQSQDFCVGANLMLMLLEAQEGNWEELDLAVRQFQGVTMALRRSVVPIVAAPFGRTLGGGVEFCLPCAHVQAAAETYMGQVETAVGIIPAGGGTMEMTKRVSERVPDEAQADILPILRWAFETLALSKVSKIGRASC